MHGTFPVVCRLKDTKEHDCITPPHLIHLASSFASSLYSMTKAFDACAKSLRGFESTRTQVRRRKKIRERLGQILNVTSLTTTCAAHKTTGADAASFCDYHKLFRSDIYYDYINKERGRNENEARLDRYLEKH